LVTIERWAVSRRVLILSAAALAALFALALLIPPSVIGNRQTAAHASPLAAVAGPGLYESDSGYLALEGQWSMAPSASDASGGEALRSDAVGSSVTLEFEGERITWLTSRGPAEGVAYVWLDGAFMPEVDLYRGGARVWQVPVGYDVPAGRHRIKVQVSGSWNMQSSGGNVTVDAFLVESGSPLPTATPTSTPAPLPTATPAASVRLDARLLFQRPVGAASPSLPVRIWVYRAGADPSSAAALYAESATTMGDGGAAFDLGTLQPGLYDLYVKGDHTLSRAVAGYSLADGDNRVDFGMLREGDVNGDDLVDDADFNLLAQAFGSLKGEPGYLGSADLNGDGIVDISDFSLLAGNHGLEGAARAAVR
jgi:hypothetical protein